MPPKIATSKLSSVPIRKYSAKRSDLPISGNRAIDFAASTSPTVAGERKVIAVNTRLRSSQQRDIPPVRKMARKRPREIADRIAARKHHGKVDHQHRKNSVAMRDERRKPCNSGRRA